MKEIDLNLLLRYVFNGCFLCVSVACCLFGFDGLWNFLNSQQAIAFPVATIALAGSLIPGALSYSIYRAVFFPLIFIVVKVFSGQTKFRSLPSQFWRHGSGARYDIKHWKRLMDEKSPQRYLSEWGGQVHLLGCSGVSSIFSSWLGNALNQGCNSATRAFFFFGLFLIFCCFVSKLRYQYRVIEMERETI